ncbi:MAG: FeoA family protein [Blautia sp.]|jgi:ferrous iron transport protein A
MSEIPLSRLKKNQTGIITRLSGSQKLSPEDASVLCRFLELGFCEGTSVTCVNTGIFKNPHAYRLRGTVIALRNEDASMILVETVTSCGESGR